MDHRPKTPLIKMRKALESSKGILLTHQELCELYDPNKRLCWDVVDEFQSDADQGRFRNTTHILKTLLPDDIVAFNSINVTLTKLEKHLKQEAKLLLELLNKRVSDSDSWITDYEIELQIRFYLKDSDPRYNDNYDNFIFDERFLLGPLNPENQNVDDWLFSTHLFEYPRIFEILENPVCGLFCKILNEHHFPQTEATNASSIWVDIDVIPQMFINL